MKKKILYLLMALLTCLQVTGCGSGKDQIPGNNRTRQDDLGERTENTRDSYIAEEIILPHEAIFYETVHNNTLYYLNYLPSGEGAVQPEQSAVCILDMDQEGAEPVEIPFILEEGQTVGRMAVDEEGAVHIISSRYVETEAGAEITDIFLTRVDRNGTIGDSYSIGEVFEDKEFMYVSAFEIDGGGNAYLGINETIYVIDRNRSLIFKTTCGGYLARLCKDDTGKVYAVWSEEGTKMLAEVDVKAQTLGTRRGLSGMTNIIGAAAGAEGSFVFATESGVYDYDREQKTLTERFQWLPLDIAVDYYDQAYPLKDGRVLWIGRTGDQWSSGKTSLWMVRERMEGDKELNQAQTQPQAEPGNGTGDVVLGVAWIDPAIKQAIVNFNQSNPDGRIEIREYGKGDYEAGAVQLNADIVSGKCPDILILPYQFPIDIYAEKGVLEDLNPYIDTDSTLQRSECQENILNVCEMDGKLYGIPVTFRVETIIGKVSVLENRKKWNMDEMIAFADSLGDVNMMFPNPTKSAVMDICLKANRDCIVDWTADGGNGFRRDFFIKMLEFSNRFMEDSWYSDEMYNERIRDGEVLFMPSGGTLLMNQHNPLGEAAYIGYPSENGSGSLAASTTTVAISSGCKAKGTAWKFIRSLLSEEVQESPLLEGYPIRKDSLVKLIERSKEASGSVMTSDTSGKVFESFDLRGATEEEIREFQDLIDSVEKIVAGNDEIYGIIMEEVGAYFNGNKTAEEVANIVENRIGVYVNEIK